MSDKFRFNFDITPKMFKELNQICQIDGETKATTLRKAVTLYTKIKERQGVGEELVMIKDNKITHRLIVF